MDRRDRRQYGPAGAKGQIETLKNGFRAKVYVGTAHHEYRSFDHEISAVQAPTSVSAVALTNSVPEDIDKQRAANRPHLGMPRRG